MAATAVAAVTPLRNQLMLYFRFLNMSAKRSRSISNSKCQPSTSRSSCRSPEAFEFVQFRVCIYAPPHGTCTSKGTFTERFSTLKL